MDPGNFHFALNSEQLQQFYSSNDDYFTFDLSKQDEVALNNWSADYAAILNTPTREYLGHTQDALRTTGSNEQQASLSHDDANKTKAIYHSGQSIPTVKEPQQANAPEEKPVTADTNPKPKSKRSKISLKVKQILSTAFRKQPYLSKNVRVELAKSTGLTERMVQNWFANTRARTDTAVGVDGSPAKGIDSSNQNASTSNWVGERSNDEPWTTMSLGSSFSNPIPTPISRPSHSRAGSVGSITSMTQSMVSKRSVDYRGSRQGRRVWKMCTTPDQNSHFADRSCSFLSPDSGFCSDDAESSYFKQGGVQMPMPMPMPTSAPTTAPLRASRYFCTWPDCQKVFRHRFEWERHEEAIHYRPYRWICCDETVHLETLGQCCYCLERDVPYIHSITESLASCAKKPVAERTFFRQDQLAPHIKRHFPDFDANKCISSRLPDLVTLWKSVNPAIDECALKCGFCGITFSTWKERTDHVFEHIRRNTCKSAWWPKRRPIVDLNMVSYSSLTCNCCKQTYSDFDTAATEHPLCITWSCRYLQDFHLTFSTHEDDLGYPVATCTLCSTEIYGADGWSQHDLAAHAETHDLRSCEQAIFLDPAAFAAHLKEEHGADWLLEERADAWKCMQGLKRVDGAATVCTMQRFEKRVFCGVRELSRTMNVIDG